MLLVRFIILILDHELDLALKLVDRSTVNTPRLRRLHRLSLINPPDS